MKRTLILFVLFAILMIGATVVFAATNHIDYAGNCPLEGDYPCRVDFGDGTSVDIQSGAFGVSHDYAFTPGGVTTYTIRLLNRNTGEQIGQGTTVIIDDRADVGNPVMTISSAGSGSNWCAFEPGTMSIGLEGENGNMVVIDVAIMGGDKEFLQAMIFGGTPYESLFAPRMENNRFQLQAYVPLDESDGQYNILVSNRHTGQPCLNIDLLVENYEVNIIE